MTRLRSLAPLLSFVCLALGGCKATPAPAAGFIDDDDLRHHPDLPFHRVWRDPDFDFDACDRIHVAEVDTDYLLTQTWWEGLGRGSKAHRDAVELAAEFRDLVRSEFRADEHHRFEVVDADSARAHPEGALVLELAIVDLVPNKALLQALTYAAGPYGVVARQGMDATSATSIAIEGRVRDPFTNRVVARFADREKKKAGLIHLDNFTWYGHVRGILEEWAVQFREVASKEPGQRVPDTKPFRLLPW
ncbi:MAG: DUF3313 family protein [Planctomycetes bacterium]|nr:DUF3313 family protein [Planctomycetota bacterium]